MIFISNVLTAWKDGINCTFVHVCQYLWYPTLCRCLVRLTLEVLIWARTVVTGVRHVVKSQKPTTPRALVKRVWKYLLYDMFSHYIYNKHVGRVWRYQRGNQNPYIEEEQKTQDVELNPHVSGINPKTGTCTLKANRLESQIIKKSLWEQKNKLGYPK